MILRGSGQLQRVRKWAAGPLWVETEKADRGRYPWGIGLRVKRRVEGPSSQGGRAWEAWVEAAKRLCEQPPSPGTPFRLPTLSPSRGRPSPGDNGESSCFRPAGDRGGKGIPGPGGRQAIVVRVSRRWFETNAAEPTSNFAPSSPLAFFIPQLPGRLVSASTDRDHPPLLAASHPSPTPWRWEGPVSGAALEPARVPHRPRHTPGGKALILPAATEPAQMLQTPLTCIDAMMVPSPQGRRGQRRRGRSCRARVTPRGPSIPGAGGGASDGKGIAPGDWLAG